MLNGGDMWIIVAVQLIVFVFVLAMLGITAFSLVRIARHLGEIANELKRGRWGSDERE
jgi:energy-converting hydrogenase Eha subunit B